MKSLITEYTKISHVINLQNNFKICKNNKQLITNLLKNIYSNINSIMCNLQNNYQSGIIEKNFYTLNMNKLDEILYLYTSIRLPDKLYDYTNIITNDLKTYCIILKNKLHNQALICGCSNILSGIKIINSNIKLDKTIYNEEYLYDINFINDLFIILNINIKSNNQLNANSKKYMNKPYKINYFKSNYKTENYLLKNEVIELNLPFNEGLVIITGYFKNDPLNIFRHMSSFKKKYNKLINNFTYLDIPMNFKDKYLNQLSVKDFILSTTDQINNLILNDYNKLLEYKSLPISLLVKDFIKGDMNKQTKILTLFLISNNEDQFLAHIIYDMIANQSYLLKSQPMAEKIYNNLHWSIQKLFKIIFKNIENKRNKINFSENDIPYDKRIELLKADDYIKNKAKEKIKEANGSRENSAKAQQYLDGLLKIPFGIYIKEDILKSADDFIRYSKLKLSKINDINYNEIDNIKTISSIDEILNKINKDNKDIIEIRNKYEKHRIEKLNYLNKIDDKLSQSIHGHNDAKIQIKRLIAQWINGEMDGAVLGLQGPPGTGKTTLCNKGIAECLIDKNGKSRPFSFLAIGGSTNGSILEGHSYTYLGSTWGRIVDILMETKCMNPIIYIDELDKVSKTEHGREIIGILTHLTDPSQNTEFTDRYFSGIKLDLSKVLFVFSYNDSNQIDRILKDRITEINIKPLTKHDKLIICNKYLLPEIYKAVGFKIGDLIFSNELIEYIIDTYTYEAGVRKLKEKLFDLIREINLNIITSTDLKLPFAITLEYIKDLFSDKPKINIKKIVNKPQIGMVNGLYATSAGTGGLTIIQVLKNLSDRRLNLELTGQQGDVMKESMQCAKTLAWNLLSKKDKDSINKDWDENGIWGLHIHCPEGGTPKDGPSAGAAITIAILSKLMNKYVNNTIAMTGEIDLHGNIHQIGGVHSKIDGAKAANVKTVLIPNDNKDDYVKYLKKQIESKNVSYKHEYSIKQLEDLADINIKVRVVSKIEEVMEIIFI